MEHLTMQLKDSVQRERDLTMRLIQSLQREAELTIKLQGSMQPRSEQLSLVVYREFAHTELQMIERIEFDEDANRKRELLQIENGLHGMQQSTGGVYFAWSDCLNCMKIGATRRDSPLMRLREISSYTTTPFTLIAWHPSSHPFRLEVAAHLHFREKRINTRGSGAGTEFFHISAADALQWVAPLGPITLKRKHDTSTPVSASDGSNVKKRKAPSGNMEFAGITVKDRVRDFINAHVVISDGGFITTRVIQDAFIAENFIPHPSLLSDSTFQKLFKDTVLDIFSDQSDVSCSRVTCDGKRVSGYFGLALK